MVNHAVDEVVFVERYENIEQPAVEEPDAQLPNLGENAHLIDGRAHHEAHVDHQEAPDQAEGDAGQNSENEEDENSENEEYQLRESLDSIEIDAMLLSVTEDKR